jgi:tetratricopeptide (TPR) repeat protein
MTLRTISLLLFLLPSSPLSGQSAPELLRQGDLAYAAFDNAAAQGHYLRAVERDPSDFTALTRLVRVQNDEGRLALRRSDSSEIFYRRALATAETLVSRFPDRAESWFLLALCHGSLVPFKGIREKLNIGRDVEANLRRSLSLDSTYAMSYVLLGIYNRSAAQLSWMERTLVNTLLGKHIIGTFEDSERALRTAIRLDPDSPYAYYELASTLRSAGRIDEAVAMLRTVVSLPYVGARERQQHEDAVRRLDRWQEQAAPTSGP